MKPYELLAALLHRDKLGTLALAKRLGVPGRQSQIHRLVNGEVKQPAHATAKPIADYFKIPIDAIYDERTATRVARELNLVALPPKEKKPRSDIKRDAGTEAQQLASEFERLTEHMSPELRRATMNQMLDLAARQTQPADEQATSRWLNLLDRPMFRDASQPSEGYLGDMRDAFGHITEGAPSGRGAATDPPAPSTNHHTTPTTTRKARRK